VAELKAKLDAADAKAVEDYEDLLAKLLAEVSIDDRWALKVLAAAGKTTEDLDGDLARGRRVAELRKLLATKIDLAGRWRRLRERKAANEAEWRAAEARARQETAAIADEERALIDAGNERDRLERELRSLSPVPKAEQERQAALRQVQAEIQRLESMIHGRRDPDELQDLATRSEEAVAQRRAELDKIPLLNIFAHQDAKRALAAAVRARDELQSQLTKGSPLRHVFSQLRGLKARRDELAAAATSAKPEGDYDDEDDEEAESDKGGSAARRQPAAVG
jgi:hypothetical protein